MDNRHQHIITQLQDSLANAPDLRQQLEQQLAANALDNPSRDSNPVRSLTDLYDYLTAFITSMPTSFRRIDQKIGYFYYIFGELQHEPQIANWIKDYNTAWGEYLNASESWNDTYYNLLKQDPLFELQGNKYESPHNWHCFNDFFARRLELQTSAPAFVAEGVQHEWLDMKNHTLDIKTAKIEHITDLLGDSAYKQRFQNGRFTHITLDMFHYHRFHSPCDGQIVDIQIIDGNHDAGGQIIWDATENRYRYAQEDNIGFQMIEKRVAIIIKNDECRIKNDNISCYVAVIPVGVAQVNSIKLNDDIHLGAPIHHGQELGYFQCGGSDIVIMNS